MEMGIRDEICLLMSPFPPTQPPPSLCWGHQWLMSITVLFFLTTQWWWPRREQGRRKENAKDGCQQLSLSFIYFSLKQITNKTSVPPIRVGQNFWKHYSIYDGGQLFRLKKHWEQFISTINSGNDYREWINNMMNLAFPSFDYLKYILILLN